MRLVLNGTSLPIAQLGPDFLVLDAPSSCPPGIASVILQVDDTERQWRVRLPNGISADSRRVILANPE
jgi:hypothetical protein